MENPNFMTGDTISVFRIETQLSVFYSESEMTQPKSFLLRIGFYLQHQVTGSMIYKLNGKYVRIFEIHREKLTFTHRRVLTEKTISLLHTADR